jgi:hypothetical protein
MKLKKILNEGHIRFSYRVDFLIEDVDNIVNNIIDKIYMSLKNNEYRTYDFIQLVEGDRIDIKQTIIKISVPHSFWGEKCVSGVYNYDVYIYHIKNDLDKNLLEYYGLIEFDYSRYNGINYIPLFYNNGQIDISTLLYGDLFDAIIYSMDFYSRHYIYSNENSNEYIKEYVNIIKTHKNDKSLIKRFLYMCQYLTRYEILKSLKPFYNELMNGDINEKNSHSVYYQSEYYKELRKVLNIYKQLLILPPEDWEPLRKIAQTEKFYSSELTISTTTSNEDFKWHFNQLYDGMVKYVDDNTSRIMLKAINYNKTKKLIKKLNYENKGYIK